ncbi:AAA-like domain-containing protein [Kamptonema formosum]|uniref:AAA-like domain-containing protein n=1 Tax=Kamptonema formosum TaxID=331992 RepID=UPI0003489C26|nr:AAA-like domain-containing protein [Oscillatoria sp. PCC 10802]
MGKLVTLKIEEGDFDQGFPVTLQIGEDGAHPSIEVHGRLPKASIPQDYQQWQTAYRSLGRGVRLESPAGQVTHCSIKDSSQVLSASINTWLKSEEFRPIREKLLQTLTPDNEVRVIVQTKNAQLRRLPWQLWDFFEGYPKAEVALSAPAYEGVARAWQAKSKVRILAILGDKTDIDINADRQFLEKLPGAETEFLAEPKPDEVNKKLWDERGWDILFFAGHSSSKPDGTTGCIYLNSTDSLTVPELKFALKTAIERGLQLAIFNSCDGLGIASDLADLNIPQIIVMREPVIDAVAQAFLKNFLPAFSGGKSLYASVREAREQLYILENRFPWFPCASWLPVICQNPAVSPLTWREISAQGLPPAVSTADAPAFYVERPPIEAVCYKTIELPGALIRIKAPKQMGKTSLMTRILHHASQQGYQTVCLNFYSAGTHCLNNLDQFLQWFCASITDELNLPDKLDDYWKGVRGSNDKCANYFQKYLLSEISTPLVLALDDVDLLFPHQETATDFFGLLRSWHEKAKTKDIWKKLRLAIAHSKEVYVPLNINQSPFNVGLAIDLPELNSAQVRDLVQRHGLDWSGEQVEQMMAMFGGHPYLVEKALDKITRDRIALEKLLQVAPTEEGPYYEHLRRHLLTLENDVKLMVAIKEVIASSEPLQIGSTEAFKLRSMGLIKFQGNAVMPLCDLYRQYFSTRLGAIQ